MLAALSSPVKFSKSPSTLIRFQTKTELISSEYGYRPHYNGENDHRKRSHSKTLSRVERFENDAFRKFWFLVWTEKTMLSENGDIIKIDTAGRQTTRPWVSKTADSRYHVASLLIGVVVWTGENNKCGHRSFWSRSCFAPFSFENGLGWAGPKSVFSVWDFVQSLKFEVVLQNNIACYEIKYTAGRK